MTVFPTRFGHAIVAEGRLSDLDPAQLAGLIERHHALLLRGFDGGSAGLIELGERWPQTFLDYRGGTYARERICGSETLFSVTGGSGERRLIPFHGEMYYKRQRPDLLWFYCHAAPRRGGHSRLCHGGELFERLSPSARAAFSSDDLAYVRRYSPARIRALFGAERVEDCREFLTQNGLEWTVDSDGVLTTIFTSNAVVEHETVGPVFINNLLPVSALGVEGSAVRWARGAAIEPELVREVWRAALAIEVRLRWQPGDLLIVDNRVLMHGRSRIFGEDREIFVRMSQAQP